MKITEKVSAETVVSQGTKKRKKGKRRKLAKEGKSQPKSLANEFFKMEKLPAFSDKELLTNDQREIENLLHGTFFVHSISIKNIKILYLYKKKFYTIFQITLTNCKRIHIFSNKWKIV